MKRIVDLSEEDIRELEDFERSLLEDGEDEVNLILEETDRTRMEVGMYFLPPNQ